MLLKNIYVKVYKRKEKNLINFIFVFLEIMSEEPSNKLEKDLNLTQKELDKLKKKVLILLKKLKRKEEKDLEKLISWEEIFYKDTVRDWKTLKKIVDKKAQISIEEDILKKIGIIIKINSQIVEIINWDEQRNVYKEMFTKKFLFWG